jgi:hypothetical protein
VEVLPFTGGKTKVVESILDHALDAPAARRVLSGGMADDFSDAAARSPSEATFGQSTGSNYRGTFFAANPGIEGEVIVHHAVEQQALKRFPGVVEKSEIHSLENLRGIPKTGNRELHLSKIRKEWNQFYRQNPSPTKQDLLTKATEIDRKYGAEFQPPVAHD